MSYLRSFPPVKFSALHVYYFLCLFSIFALQHYVITSIYEWLKCLWLCVEFQLVKLWLHFALNFNRLYRLEHSLFPWAAPRLHLRAQPTKCPGQFVQNIRRTNVQGQHFNAPLVTSVIWGRKKLNPLNSHYVLSRSNTWTFGVAKPFLSIKTM